MHGDPFEGIETDDINRYADLHSVDLPESDDQARQMAAQIKGWVDQGRPDPKHEHEPAEPIKKKRSFFGRFRK